MLEMPVVTMVREISANDGNTWEVKASLENGYRRLKVILPVVLTVTRDLNSPKTLSFSGIIKARKKSCTLWSPKDLDLPTDECGLKGSPTIVTEMQAVESTRVVEFLEGTRDEKAEQMVQKLVDAGAL
jgi:electron transfer flavoprotein beta subunit